MHSTTTLNLSFSGKKLTKALFVACIIMFSLNLIGIYFKIYQGKDSSLTNMIYYFFDASREGSVQTFFSALLLCFASAIVFLIGRMLDSKDATRKYWFVLGGIFCYLALDESLMFHEQFNKLRPVVNDKSGFLFFTWVLPYAGLVLLAGLFFFRFLLVLAPITRNLFIVSGVIYVGAAIGFELFEGYIVHNGGVGSHGDVLLPPIEEFFEMCGIALFVYACLRHVKTFQKNISLKIQ